MTAKKTTKPKRRTPAAQDPPRRGRGRPSLGERTRLAQVSIRLTGGEYLAIAELATAAGVGVADYIRTVALEGIDAGEILAGSVPSA